jgi:hypothetical protein
MKVQKSRKVGRDIIKLCVRFCILTVTTRRVLSFAVSRRVNWWKCKNAAEDDKCWVFL